VVDALQTAAERSQGDVGSILEERAADVTPFWVFNGFAATVDGDTLSELSDHPDVASITLDTEYSLPEPVDDPGQPLLPGWGLERVNAPQAWGEYGVRGQGVVVGVMDSGVDGGHPALADSWRGRDGDTARSWFAATGENYPEPGDGGGHGTHVAGSIVGAPPGEVTGVAPEAEWIAAKIFFDSGSTSESIIHSGFQWMLAPGGDPAAAPDVVNNSWGAGDGTLTTFWDDVDAWVAAGIVPVFANGNNGPAQGTVGSPGSYPHTIGIGATDEHDRIAIFSSRGSAFWDGVEYRKPQVSAPGRQVRSTWPLALSDDGYHTISGTSMAAPHATGVIALMLSAAPDLTIDEVRDALESSARTEPHMGALPDNNYGAGIVDAFAAVTHVAHSGTVTGTVAGPDGPLEATVAANGQTTTSDAETGAYELTVRAGDHELTASAYGFDSHTRQIAVTAGGATTADLTLTTAAEYQLAGTVTGPDGPIDGARIAVEGAPVDTVETGTDGRFTATVAAGRHTLRITAAGFAPHRLDIELTGDQDVVINLDRLDQPSEPGWTQFQNNPARTGLAGQSLAAATLERGWQSRVGGAVTFSSPVIGDGHAYVGDDAGRLTALDVDTGDITWTYDTGSVGLRGAPAVSGGMVFIGGGQGGGIRALDSATGDEVWSIETPGRQTIYTAPTVVGDVVYAATGPSAGRDDTVFALDAETGEQLWATDVGESVFAGPAVAAGLAVVGNASDGQVIALDTATGSVEWTFTRTEDYFIGGASLVDVPGHGDTVHIATTDGDSGGSLLAIDAATGELIWENASHGDGQGTTPAAYGDLIIAGSHGTGGVAAYDAATGDVAWRYNVSGAVSASVLVSDDGYVVGGAQLDRRIFALDAATGELAWEEPVAANVTSSAAYADGRLVTADTRGDVHAFHTTGAIAGTVTDADGAGLPAEITIEETGATVIADESGRYEVREIPGTVTVTASLFGFSTESVDVEIVAGRTAGIDFELTAVGDGAITGTVTDADGEPLAGASVTLTGTPLDPAVTGADGAYTFGEVAAGTYRATADADGYASVEETVTVVSGETTTADFTLERFDVAVVADYESRVTDALAGAGWRADRVGFDQIVGTLDQYEAVVISGMGDDRADADLDRFAQIVDEADQAGTSLVFLDTGGPSYGSIRTLSNVTGDPAQDGASLSSRGEVWLEDVKPHPITASLDSDRVSILTSGSWHAWFSDYSGYSLATLGSDRDGPQGDGIGYQRRTLDSNHILLPSLAPSPWSDWQPVGSALLADAVAHAAGAAYGAVEGHVSDADGNPVEATVEVVDGLEQTTADADGNYRVIMEPGDYTLRFRFLGAGAVEMPVSVVAGQTTAEDVTLPALTLGVVAGAVTEEGTDRPVAGATVTVEGLPPVLTGSDGDYLVDDVPGGTYGLTVEADGYEPLAVEDVVVTEGAVTTVDAELVRAPGVVVVGDRNDEITTFLEDHSIPVEQTSGWEVVEDLDGVEVVILHNPPDVTDPDEFRSHLDAFDEAGVSVIFPADGWGTRTRGIDLLVRHTGNPSGYGRIGGISGPEIFLHELTDHPIFAGVGNDPAQLLTAASEAAYFPDYDGIALADIAESGSDPAGIGIAYDVRSPDSVHVLLSGLAATLRNSPGGNWTPDGQRIFVNAVRWAAAPGQGGLAGTVTDDAGEPIADAVVEVDGSHWQAVTDEDGLFEIGVPPGEHTLTYRAFGYAAAERTFTVEPDQTVDASVELAVGDVGAITGVVGSSDGGVLEEVRVQLRGTSRTTLTSTDGSYTFDRVEAGEHELELEVDGHVRTLSAVEVGVGETAQHDVTLRVSPLVGIIDDSDFTNSRDRGKEFLADWGYEVEDIEFGSLDRIPDVDLVVANVSDFGLDVSAAELQAFEETVNRFGIPVLWMGQHNRGGIELLHEHHGDPGVIGQGFNDGTVTANVVEDHPLVAGLPEQFELMQPNGRYTYFDEFNGTTVATLATGDDGELGATIAYRGRTAGTVDVLLSTLSVTTWGAPSTRETDALNWTPEAERIFVNAVAWALDSDGLGAEVVGTVTSDRDGLIQSEVEVVETGRTYTGRAGDGTFLVPLQPGTWTLQVSAFGHGPSTIEVTVGAGDVVTEAVTLTAAPAGTVAGTVTGPDGSAVSGADVALLDTSLSAVTGADGRYTIGDVPAGDWTVRVTADGFRAHEVPVTVTADGTAAVDVQLQATAQIAVVDTTGSSTHGTSLATMLEHDGYEVDLVSRSNLTELAEEVADYDLVIFNPTFLSSQQEQFLVALDAAADAGVSTILPSQFGNGFAIPQLSNRRGDPGQVDWGFVSEGVDYVPAVEHPIFDGFPAGEPVELITSTLSNRNQQWGSYSDWSGETIANVQSRVNGDDLGEAVGYRFTSASSVDVLLGSLSAGGNGYPDERWTDNARKIYLNAVGWAIDARQAELTGVVTGDGAPVSGATVTAVEAGVADVTGADGAYTLGLAAGEYSIEVSAFGFETFADSVVVPEAGSVTFDIELAPLPRGNLEGVVTSAGGDPVVGAVLTGDGPMTWEATSGEDGRFDVEDLVEGDYEVSVSANGFVSAEASVTIVADEDASLEVTLQPLDVAVLGDVTGDLTEFLRTSDVAATTLEWGADVAGYEVVVVNGGSPDEATFLAMLDAADAAEVSLVFTGTWGVTNGGIRLLERYTDRVNVGAHGYGDGPVVLSDFDQSRPLFSGLADPATLITDGGYYSLLDSYAGTPLASLSVEADGADPVSGLTAGYDWRTDGSVEILLSASAVTDAVGPGRGWTSAGGQLLINAIEWAAEPVPWGFSWDVQDERPVPLVRLRLDDVPVFPAPAESATLVVRHSESGDEVARRPMTWAAMFYQHALRGLASGDYRISAELVRDGTLYEVPGPLLTVR
jgi:outer membrane protein assembly factor BamB/protocatechuate 3,4-dioxygenase beta subunit